MKKGKAGKIGAGAVVGSIIAPGLGTAVGAAMGAGSKGKKNIQSSTTSISQQTEIPTPATLKLKNISTGEIFGLTFNCTSQLDAKIKAFNFDGEDFAPAPSQETLPEWSIDPPQTASDPYEELKKLKELLDMDIISQEEFDIKKQRLLNL